MEVTSKVTIDLKKPSFPATLYAVQGDRNTRCAEVSIYSDGEEWQIPSGVSIFMRYSKPDYTAGYYDTMPDGTRAWSVQGNVITIQLAPQMLTVVGTVTAQLELILGDAVLGTFSFCIRVEGNPAADMIASEDYINWLQWIEDELGKYVNAVKESGEFHGGTLSGPVNMNSNRLFGLAAPVSDNDAAPLGLVRRAAPPNLLDNSDFANPVNQRGLSTYSGAVYGIDRWCGRVNAQTVSVRNEDTTVTATETSYAAIKQKIENIAKYTGKTVTLACSVYSTSSIAVGFANESDTVLKETVSNVSGSRIVICTYTIPSGATVDTVIPRLLLRTTAANDYMRLYWAALYEGEYTAETLPEYQAKGYAAELAECMRYYQVFKHIICPGYVTSSGLNYTISVFGNSMRIRPTVTLEGYIARQYDGYSIRTGSTITPPTDVVVGSNSDYISGNFIIVDRITTPIDGNNSIMIFQCYNLILSADL